MYFLFGENRLIKPKVTPFTNLWQWINDGQYPNAWVGRGSCDIHMKLMTILEICYLVDLSLNGL